MTLSVSCTSTLDWSFKLYHMQTFSVLKKKCQYKNSYKIMKICFSSCGTLSFIERSLWSGVELTLVLHQGRQSTAPFGTVHFLGQWALSTCCLLFWFKLVQGPTNMHFTVHLISAQSSQEGIECNKTKEKLRSYCQISILYLLGSAAMRVRHARLTSLPTSLPGLPKLSLPCRAKRGNPHSNAYPNSCVQIKEAWHCTAALVLAGQGPIDNGTTK